MPLMLILLKVTLLLAIALGLTIAMHRASAGSRHLVWLVALAGLLVLPLLATWAPLHLRVLPAVLNTAPAAPPFAPASSGVSGPRGQRQAITDPPPATTPPAGMFQSTGVAPASPVRWLGSHAGEVLLLLWLGVAAMLGAWLSYGAWSVRRIVGRAVPLAASDWQRPLYEIADRLGLDAAPRLLRSTDVRMPFACGVLDCAIVLPAECDEWSADRRSAVLIHELGHVRRRDLVGHTLGRLACAIYWFHPMVWTAARRLRAESERACDDLALRFGARPSNYAEHLLDIVTCVRDHATPSVALALAHRKEFEGRMLAILDPELRRTAAGRIQGITIGATLALVTVAISAAAPPKPVVSDPAPIRTSAVGKTHGTTRQDTGAHERPLPIAVHTSIHTDVRTDTRLSYTRQQSLYGLGKHGYHERDSLPRDTTARIALLVQLLRTDSSAEVRRIAAWGLSQYADGTSAKQALTAAFTADANDRVREMAAWALVDAGDADVSQLTTAAVRDASPAVRETATWGLGSSGKPATASTLAQVLARDTDAAVRASAAWGLGQLGLETAPKALLSALSDPAQDVREKAAWATSEIGDSAALPQIRSALRQEKSPEVEKVLLRALIRSGEAPEKMVEWLKSGDASIREAAARALAGGNATEPWPWPWPRPRPQP